MKYDSKIRAANTWWLTSEIQKDQKIIDWHHSQIKYEPQLMHKIEYDFEPHNTVVYTLRGTRQVGKTTMIKLQIMRFLKMGVCPWNVFYYLLDITESKSDLVDIIDSYMRISKKYRTSSRIYLFLDEITSVDDWQKGIKWLVDNNMLANCTVLATGSQADKILNAHERLPGRRGRVDAPYDMLLVPMKFSEFVSIQSKEIKQLVSRERLSEKAKRKEIFDQLSNKSIPPELDLYQGFVDELNDHLHEYLLTGGLPRVVDEKAKTSVIDASTYADYVDGVQGDWGDRNKNLLKQFVKAVADSQCSDSTWHSLQQRTQIGSWSTVQDYAFLLQDMSTISIVHKYGEKLMGPRLQHDKKLYFRDPFYLHMFRGWGSSTDPFTMAEQLLADEANLGCVVEGAVADHLIRWAFAVADSQIEFDYANHVFFWKDQNNKEVDFVLYKEGGYEIPIEVKYRNRINAKQLGGLSSFLDQTCSKGGLVLSKDGLEDRSDYVVVPASVFLALI